MSTPAPDANEIHPLLRRWLEDVSTLVSKVEDRDQTIKSMDGFVHPDIVKDLKKKVATLQEQVRSKDSDIEVFKSTEEILRNSISALEQDVSDSVAAADKLKAELDESKAKNEELEETLRQQREESDQELKKKDNAVSEAKGTVQTLRVELGREKIEGRKRVLAEVQQEHNEELQKSHQTGKDKGIAVATAYIDAASEAGADLERAPKLASHVVIQSARRMRGDIPKSMQERDDSNGKTEPSLRSA